MLANIKVLLIKNPYKILFLWMSTKKILFQISGFFKKCKSHICNGIFLSHSRSHRYILCIVIFNHLDDYAFKNARFRKDLLAKFKKTIGRGDVNFPNSDIRDSNFLFQGLFSAVLKKLNIIIQCCSSEQSFLFFFF